MEQNSGEQITKPRSIDGNKWNSGSFCDEVQEAPPLPGENEIGGAP
jgi:hypothetical protein